MGLDMFVYALKKLDATEIEKVKEFKTLQEFYLAGYDCLHFPLETAGKEISSDMYKEVLCCSSEFIVDNEGITEKSLDEYLDQKGIPNDSFISYVGDDLVIGGFYKDSPKLVLSKEEQKKLYTSWKEKIFVYKMEEVAYWRKAYNLAEFFIDNIESNVENCGFYEIDENTLLEAIRMDDGRASLNKKYFINPFSRDDALQIKLAPGEKLFYHEWY